MKYDEGDLVQTHCKCIFEITRTTSKLDNHYQARYIKKHHTCEYKRDSHDDYDGIEYLHDDNIIKEFKSMNEVTVALL